MRIHFLHLFLIILAVFFITILYFPLPVQAAKISLEASQTTMGVGQHFEIAVYVNSEGETINALSGTIRLPSFLSVRSVRDGNSLVGLWRERPKVSGNDVTFSGIVPGGWRGASGSLFSLIMETTALGSGKVDFSDTLVLLHDGKGTPAPLSLGTLSLNVDSNTPLVEFTEEVEDYEPPEAFALRIASDPELFSGDSFVIFVTQDKGSGIDHYEILETRKKLQDETEGEWERVESPYRLHDQSLKSFVYVRAVDRAGNVRVSVNIPEEQSATLQIFIALAILLFFIIIISFVRKMRA